MILNIKKKYTTDGKVVHLSNDEEINVKLSKIIGKKFIDYRKKWDDANNFIVPDFPLFLQIELNQTCNFKCPHCIIGNKKLVEKYYSTEEIDFNFYKRIVDEGSDYDCPSISPQGNNEPFLMKDLEKYIQYAHSKGFIDIMLNNNASALTEKRSKSLLDSGLTRLRFSLDAVTPETFKKIRVGSPPLERIKKNIYTFLELKKKGNYKLPITGVSFCELKQNQHELTSFIKEWEDKVDIVSIQKFQPPSFEEDFSKFYTDDQYVKKEINNFKCVQPFQRVTFRNNEITPCCASFSSLLKIGDLKTGTIHDAWHSPGMVQLREMHKKGEHYKNIICKKCVDGMYPVAKN